MDKTDFPLLKYLSIYATSKTSHWMPVSLLRSTKYKIEQRNVSAYEVEIRTGMRILLYL